MSVEQPVGPQYGSGQVLSPAAASANVTVPATKQLILTNLGVNVCYVRCGATSQTATTADYPCPPGLQVTITKGELQVNMAHISAGGTTLHVMGGEGW